MENERHRSQSHVKITKETLAKDLKKEKEKSGSISKKLQRLEEQLESHQFQRQLPSRVKLPKGSHVISKSREVNPDLDTNSGITDKVRRTLRNRLAGFDYTLHECLSNL